MLPPEMREFATTVALVPPEDWDAFTAAAAKHALGTPENMAHALNAFANQWTRKHRVPNSHVAALMALLNPARRDRLTAQSWTVKKWVQGNRAAMVKAAQVEAVRRRHDAIHLSCKSFLGQPRTEQAADFDLAAGALLALAEPGQPLKPHATNGWHAVQIARDESRRRALVPGGGMTATDLGCALAWAHKCGTLEKALTDWVHAG